MQNHTLFLVPFTFVFVPKECVYSSMIFPFCSCVSSLWVQQLPCHNTRPLLSLFAQLNVWPNPSTTTANRTRTVQPPMHRCQCFEFFFLPFYRQISILLIIFLIIVHFQANSTQKYFFGYFTMETLKYNIFGFKDSFLVYFKHFWQTYSVW